MLAQIAIALSLSLGILSSVRLMTLAARAPRPTKGTDHA